MASRENYILRRLLEIDEALGIKKRVRDGGARVQRRFKFSKNKSKSFDNRTGKKTTITAADRAKMSRRQKVAAKKRKATKPISQIKRKKSMRKRKNLGFDRKT